MNLRVFRLCASPLHVAALAVAVAGCGLPLDAREPRFWEGTFEPVQDASIVLTGPAAMVANQNDTRASVAVESPDLDLDLSWTVRSGACDEDGSRIAPQQTFPALRFTGGVWTADAVIFRRIERVGTFAAEIYQGPDAAGDLLACADLLQRDAPSRR